MRKLAATAVAIIISGCAPAKWSASNRAEDAVEAKATVPNYGLGDQAPALAISTSPAAGRARPDEALPPGWPRDRKVRFYSDLGPDVVDVSAYPTQQKYNYKVYANVCSRCHSLARSINIPVVSRAYWDFYLLSMGSRNRRAKLERITPEERKAIVDFLAFDSHERKVAHDARFDAMTEELKRRFQEGPPDDDSDEEAP
jgi:hypothetical protein